MPRPTPSAHSSAATPRARPSARLTADERRAEIVEAAVRSFASGGLAGTSTEDIARLAGVSQPYLFRLFGTKRELFLAAVARSFDRIEAVFRDAARHAGDDGGEGTNPVLVALGRAYTGLLRDQSVLRLQLHAFAACDDPLVRDDVRGRFAALVALVSDLSGTPGDELRPFFAEGMLMNVAAAMELTDRDVAWAKICADQA